GGARPQEAPVRYLRATAAVVAAGIYLLPAAATAGANRHAPLHQQAPTRAALSFLDITGHGWGHGRGMGQYGAYGYASMYGWSYSQILGYYYGGTALRGGYGGQLSVHIVELDRATTSLQGPGLTATWATGSLSASPLTITRSGSTLVVSGHPAP